MTSRRLSRLEAALISALLTFFLIAAGQAAAATPEIRFFDDGKQLPDSFQIGLDYQSDNTPFINLAGTERRLGLANLESGLEWNTEDKLSARVGYKPDVAGEGPVSGLGAGVELQLKPDQRISYACLPFEGNGPAHFLSFTQRFG